MKQEASAFCVLYEGEMALNIEPWPFYVLVSVFYGVYETPLSFFLCQDKKEKNLHLKHISHSRNSKTLVCDSFTLWASRIYYRVGMVKVDEDYLAFICSWKILELS